jgi:hypothetical protein
MASCADLDPIVESAAWLHDIGHAASVATTGFHALDGARFLVTMGADTRLVSLVAYHSGAEFEAEERGLESELAQYDWPDPLPLDVLTFADMTTSVIGERVSVSERVLDIFTRYDGDHPVHRATLRSQIVLVESVQRVAMRSGRSANVRRLSML